MANFSLDQNVLRDKTKRIFSARYGKEVSDAEAEEIMQNLLTFMEVVVKKEYN
jgi:hypothetical protein